jgi:hypothetical protein
VSSAILYLAIVAIWAFLLVPRWIKRPHTAFFASSESGRGGEADGSLADSQVAGSADTPAPRFGLLRTLGLISSESPEAPAARADEWLDDGHDEEPEPDTAPLAPITDPAPPASAPRAPVPPAHAEDAEPYLSSETDDSAQPAEAQPAGPTRQPVSRTKILQARRRLLTTLVLLAIAALSCTALRLTSPWVCIPPAVMLGMYMLLLREAAHADAENARQRAEAQHAARQRARARARERAQRPGAEIIDINDRLGDQLYDQYADATVRAVGD